MPKNDYIKLKNLLIFWTIINIFYLVFIMFFSQFSEFFVVANHHIFYLIISFFIILIFIYFVWKKTNLEIKYKRNYTFMILIIGIIGMWFFIIEMKNRAIKS